MGLICHQNEIRKGKKKICRCECTCVHQTYCIQDLTDVLLDCSEPGFVSAGFLDQRSLECFQGQMFKVGDIPVFRVQLITANKFLSGFCFSCLNPHYRPEFHLFIVFSLCFSNVFFYISCMLVLQTEKLHIYNSEKHIAQRNSTVYLCTQLL